MNGQDLYKALSYVDPAMVEQAVSPSRRRHWRRGVLIAACLCLLLTGTALALLRGVEIHVLDPQGRETDAQAPTHAYQAVSQVELTPLDSLSSQAREDGAAGRTSHAFDSWDHAMDYLGLDLPGPEGATQLFFTLENGEVAEIRLMVHQKYEQWNASVLCWLYLYTEHFAGTPGETVQLYGDFDAPQAQEIPLPGGDVAQLIPSFSGNGHGTVTGFLARGQGFYMVNALCPEEYEQQVTQLVTDLLGQL